MKSAEIDRFRREMSSSIPTGHNDISDVVYTIRRTIAPKPPEPRQIRLIDGIWMIEEADGWRQATAAEIMGRDV